MRESAPNANHRSLFIEPPIDYPLIYGSRGSMETTLIVLLFSSYATRHLYLLRCVLRRVFWSLS